MFISRKQKPFLRVLSILIIIAIIGMSFPGMLMASEINGFPQATENSTVSQASQPLNTNPIDLSENNNVTSLPQPDKDKLPSSKDNDIGNGIHIIHESNMPNFNETPKPFIPDPKLLGSNNTVPASNASENNYQSNNDNMLYYTNNAQFDFIDTGTPSGNGSQPPSTTGNNATEPTGTPSDNGSQNPSTIDSNATGTADTPSNNGNQNPSATDLTNSDKTQTGGNDQDLTDNEPASQDSNDYPIKNTGGSYIAGFSRQAGKNLLKFTMANSSLVLSPLKASTVSAQIDKNTISFKDLYPHTDFSYTAQQNFLKEDITINQATTRSALYFQFNLQNAVAQVQPSGEISFADPVTGKVLFYMDKPIALDNNDNPCQNVNMGITKQGFLKLSVDSAWLKDAAYPINIEPTIYLAEDSSSMPDLGNTYPIENKGGLYKVGFNSQSGQNLLQYIQGKASITLDLLNSNPVNGMISDNNIVYRNIYPDVDLRYTANQYQLKETLVVKKATGQSEFNFQLGVNNASYKVSDNGIINFYEQGNTAPSFYMSKPFAVDANGNRCDSVALALTGEGALKLSVDSDWLKKAAYPVTIDPTINLTGSEGTGNKPFWNYTNSNLGGGWNFSVNTFNLNLLLSKALFQIPGRGIPIGESVTYNSQDNTSAELGTGWHLGSDISLTVNSDESVIYVAGDGGVYLFTPNGSGGYNAPAGIYLTLAKNPTTGLYTLTDKKLNVTTFLSNGKPDTIVDHNGNTTKYNYDADGRLSTLQDPSGRTITYAYNDSDQLSSIKDPTNKVYNFAYQNNLLTSITDPAHNNFTFIYDANNHLNSFTDPLNKVTTFSVSADGKLQSYNDARSNSQDIYQTSFVQTYQASLPIKAGNEHSIALKIDGTVWDWGFNEWGSLGDGTTTDRSTPVQISRLTGIIAIAVGNFQSLALKSDGTVWAWGRNNCGQIGDGTTTDRSIPMQVSGLSGITAIAAGGDHSLAIKSDGTVWAWGENYYGELGDGTTTNRSTPVQVSGLSGITAIVAGGDHSFAIKSDGTVWAWGDNYSGQLGDGTTTIKKIPVQISSLTGITAIALGSDHSLALKSDGTVWSWGENENGQLGDGTTTNRATPVQVSDLSEITSISAGYDHSLALKSDGTVWAWGWNNCGQLGDGTTTDRSTPVQVSGLNGIAAIASGGEHSLAIKSDSTVWAWGANTNGQLGDGTTTQRLTPVEAIFNGNPLTVLTVTDPGGHIYTYYSDPNTENLTKYADQLGDTWHYTWNNNNLMSVRDAKGTTSYTYDNNGNVLTKITTVDGNPADNITETMTYDNNNQLIKIVDGSGRVANYQYDVKGNLLSTNNPNNKDSNGKLYDQYGNVLQSSPMVSGNQNLLKNGSFETGGLDGAGSLANWTHAGMGSTVTLPQGQYNTHGNYSLEMSSTSATTDWYYQTVTGLAYGDKLTLRADVTADNISGPNSGAYIQLDYANGHYDSYYFYGSGSIPSLILTSQAANTYVIVNIGLYHTSGTAWFDGVQLEDAGDSSDGDSTDGYILSAYNSVENGGFENGLNNWTNSPGTSASVTTEAAYQRVDSAKLTLSTNGNASIYQDVPLYSGAALTFSGMAKTSNVTGTGAYYHIDYYNSSGQMISSIQTGYVTGTQDFTELSCLATAPSGAYYARVSAILNGSGTAYFDNVKLVPRTTQQYTYDSAGNYLLVSEDALGNQDTQTYNENIGTVTSSTDACDDTTNYSYDNLNRLVQVTDPNINKSYYSYDGDNNLTVSRDPRSSNASDNTYVTVFTPSELNQLGTLIDPLDFTTANIYDRSGNLTNVSLPNGLALTYTYDNANRMTQKQLSGGKYFNYTYDGANNLTEVTDQNNNNYTWAYDGASRVASSTDPSGYTLGYQWDKSNNLTSESNTGTGNVNYTYGSDNRLTSVTLPDGDGESYNYDENGRLFEVRYSGNIYERNILYLNNGWVNIIQDPAFPGRYQYQYYYNDNGNIRSISSWAGSDNYVYDQLGRLTNWDNDTSHETYSYDQAGNLTTKGSRTFTYNAANEITNSGFFYDANGNMTSDGTYNYTYDAENRLTQVNKVSDNSLVASYTYYYNGLRKSKTVNGVTTTFDWDAFGRLVREIDTNGNATAYYYDSKGNPVGLIRNGQTYYYHTNQRGDVVTVAYWDGDIVAQYNYDPWGNIISTSGTLSQPFTYAGYYHDSETGLYYLQNRYYSPTLGRFLTKDGYGNNIKLSNPQTLNLYAYAGNNPVSNVDPTGTSDVYVNDDNGSTFGYNICTYADGHHVINFNDGTQITVSSTNGELGKMIPDLVASSVDENLGDMSKYLKSIQPASLALLGYDMYKDANDNTGLTKEAMLTLDVVGYGEATLVTALVIMALPAEVPTAGCIAIGVGVGYAINKLVDQAKDETRAAYRKRGF